MMFMPKKIKKKNDKKEVTAAENFTQNLMNQLDEEFEKEKSKKDEIMSNTDYICWLETFTKIYPYFAEDDWAYSSNEISKEDKKNVEALEHMYFGVKSYAIKNSISFNRADCLEYYLIKYNNIGYEIGEMEFQGGNFYCQRVEIQKGTEDEFIDFVDIIKNKKQGNVEQINKQLNELSKFIENLVNEDVPVEAIQETVDKVLKKL